MINEKFRWLGMLLFVLFLVPVINGAERREIPDFVELGNYSEESALHVAALIDDFKATWAAQDAQAHPALFAEDAEWINAYARLFRGKEELTAFLRDRLFPNFDPLVSQEEMRNARLVSIRHLSEVAAVIHIVTDGSRGESAISGELLRRTHIHLVAEKQADKWLIVHTAIMDARG